MKISKNLEISCMQCKIKFNRFQYQIKKAKTHFCSKKCLYLFRWGTSEERLFNQVSKSPENGCWIFYGLKDKQGYGKILRTKAHRLSWELKYGSIPKGLCVCHSCDNPSCVNPDHLWLGTNADNMRDKILKGRLKGGIGSRHASAKLTEEQIPFIRKELQECKNKTELAKKYDITVATLNKIQNNITWQHA